MVDMFVSVHVEESKFMNMHKAYVSKKIEIKTNKTKPAYMSNNVPCSPVR